MTTKTITSASPRLTVKSLAYDLHNSLWTFRRNFHAIWVSRKFSKENLNILDKVLNELIYTAGIVARTRLDAKAAKEKEVSP